METANIILTLIAAGVIVIIFQNIFHLKKQSKMAVDLDQINASLDAIGAGLDEVSAEISDLKAQVAGQGLSAEQEQVVSDRIEAIVAKVNALKPAPTVPETEA